MELIKYIIDNSTRFVESGGLIVGFLLVFIESFIPLLPLSVFVALNVNAFGFLLGFLLSWGATCLGSYLCYRFFNYISYYFNKIMFIKKFNKNIAKIENIKFSELVLILTLPFTPSFLINILCGITHMKIKKFIFSILIGKFFTILCWGYIGKSVIKSVTNINSLIYILITLIISYIISKIISKKINIE